MISIQLADSKLCLALSLAPFLPKGMITDHRPPVSCTPLNLSKLRHLTANLATFFYETVIHGMRFSPAELSFCCGQVARQLTCGCLENEGVEKFLGCPSGACDDGKNRRKIARLLKKAEGEKVRATHPFANTWCKLLL